MAPPMKPSREEMLAVTMNQKLAKQGAKSRKLAEARDVNTMPDPKTYAAVMGLLGERPDEMGFSVAHPKYKEIMDVADPAFALGTAAQVVPLVKPAGQAVRGAAKALAPKAGQMVMDAAQATGMPVYGLGVVKPRGGNWLAETEGRIKSMRPYADLSKSIDRAKAQIASAENAGFNPRTIADMKDDLRALERDQAVNNWTTRNLGNYIKKEMGTPDDPVRKLAEEGIVHAPHRDFIDNEGNIGIANERKRLGFPAEGMGQSPDAKAWEEISDFAIKNTQAKQIQGADKDYRLYMEAKDKANNIYADINVRFDELAKSTLPPGEAIQQMVRLPFKNKAQTLGREGEYEAALKEASKRYQESNAGRTDMLEENPWVAKLDPEERLYTGYFGDLGFDHIIDVLREDVRAGRIRPEQLSKVSMEQAVRRTHEYDLEMAKRMNQAATASMEGFPVHKEYPEGYKWIELSSPENVAAALEHQKKFEKELGRRVSEHPGDERGKIPVEKIKQEIIQELGPNPAQKLEEALKYEGESMGHCVGGYCPDVLEGRSRIYSLRDAKGQPHVTVEVNPPHRDRGFIGDQRPRGDEYYALQDQYVNGQRAGEISPNLTFAEWWRAQNGIPEVDISSIPPSIRQIKGKQNAAPKEAYLPYVQDFVRSGNWSKVGDLYNTGLRDIEKTPHLKKWLQERGIEHPRYLTEKEYGAHEADFLLNKLKPEEGMKDGGEVKMGIGGVLALGKGAQKAEKGAQVIKASEAFGAHEGLPVYITQSDRTKVGQGFLGGPGFSGLQHTSEPHREARAAWGVKTPGVANTIVGDPAMGKNPLFTTMIGSPTQHQSNQMVFDKMYRQFKNEAKKGNLSDELRFMINDKLAKAVDKDGKNVFPPNVDILSKDFHKMADTFDRRSIAGHLMGGVGIGGKKGQIIDYDKIIKGTTDPGLIDAPSGAIGNRIFTLDKNIINRPDLHPAFPTIMTGEDMNVMYNPVPRELFMQDFINQVRNEKGRNPGYLDYIRGRPPSQFISEDWLTKLQKEGHKKGGLLKVKRKK